jgi:uncharacterized membrane protein
MNLYRTVAPFLKNCDLNRIKLYFFHILTFVITVIGSLFAKLLKIKMLARVSYRGLLEVTLFSKSTPSLRMIIR